MAQQRERRKERNIVEREREKKKERKRGRIERCVLMIDSNLE